jgi:phage/plasmid-like protein (TIGR03299 family)
VGGTTPGTTNPNGRTLTMAHQVEKMMYVGETPWHGLGVKLTTPPATTEEAIKVAGLDWVVRKEQLFLKDGREVPRFATVRSTDNKILGTVGAGYRVMQNRAFAQFFDPFLESGHATIETAGSLRGGSRVWMMAKIKKPDSVIVKKADDRVAKYLLLAQGHDGSLATFVGLTPTRVVCQNTLSAVVPAAAGVKQRADVSANGTLRIRHTANAEAMLLEVKETIDRAERDFEKAAEFFRSLAGKNVRSAKKLREYVDAVFPPTASKKREEAEEAGEKVEDRMLFSQVEALFQKGRGNDLPGVKGTAWAAYNAVTEYLTWERGKNQDQRLQNVFLPGSSFPKRAIEMAGKVLLAA